MATNKNEKAAEIFGGVSEFRGAFCAEGKVNFPKQEEAKTPGWHASCFDGKEESNETHVKEEELCSHF